MAYNRDVTGLQSTLAMIERIDSPQQLQQIAQQYQQQPNGGAIIAAALAQAQKLKQLQSGMLASDKAGGEGQEGPPVVDEAIASINPRQLAEDVGIGRLPAGNMDFAEGGIVAFAGGGSPREKYEQMIREEAERQGVDPEHMLRLVQAESGFDPQIVSPKGAAGLFQLMPGTARDRGLTEKERFIPEKAVPAGIGYFKQQLDRFGGDYEKATAAYNWGPNRQALAKDDWKLGLPKETAAYLTRVMPMGAAQADALPPPKGQTSQAAPPAQTVSPADDGTVYDPMTGVPVYQGTPTTYAESPAEILKEMAAPVVKGVTKAAKVITSAPKTRAELEEEADAKRERFSTGEYRGKSGDPDEDIGPAQAKTDDLPMSEKKMIGLAKEAIPASERKGWTDDMLMQFFLSMMAGQSPNALANIGAAGLSALKYGQEAKKAELEREKDRQAIRGSEAEARYKTAQARSLESEEKTDARLRIQAATLAQKELEDWQKENFGATPAQVAAKRQELFSIYTAALRQQDTMGAGGTGFKVLGSRQP